jgi:hypothetical protein
MTSAPRYVILAATVLTVTASGCGHVSERVPARDPAEAVRVLQRQGYRPVLGNVSMSPASIVVELRLNARYGRRIAEYERNGLRVMILQGNRSTPRVPHTDWYRSGNTILVSWPSNPAQGMQFRALVAALR